MPHLQIIKKETPHAEAQRNGIEICKITFSNGSVACEDVYCEDEVAGSLSSLNL